MKKILFICKFNRFRSRVAEAYFRKISPKAKVKSAGIIQGTPLNQDQVNAALDFGIDIRGKPKGLTSKMLAWQDITIIVADDVPEEIFNNKKYKKEVRNWKISDGDPADKEKIGKIVKAITTEVNKLDKELKWKP